MGRVPNAEPLYFYTYQRRVLGNNQEFQEVGSGPVGGGGCRAWNPREHYHHYALHSHGQKKQECTFRRGINAVREGKKQTNDNYKIRTCEGEPNR